MITFEGDCVKLLEEIGKARLEFDGLVKDANGQVGNKRFKYMTLGTLVAAIETPLSNHGVSFIQPYYGVSTDECGVATVFSGHGGTIRANCVFKKPANVQEFGRELTYHRRYALQSFLVLEGDDDADAPRTAPVPAPVPSSPEAVAVNKAENPVDTATVNSKSLKDKIYDEKERLKLDSKALADIFAKIVHEAPARTTDAQKQEVLDYLLGMPTP